MSDWEIGIVNQKDNEALKYIVATGKDQHMVDSPRSILTGYDLWSVFRFLFMHGAI